MDGAIGRTWQIGLGDRVWSDGATTTKPMLSAMRPSITQAGGLRHRRIRAGLAPDIVCRDAVLLPSVQLPVLKLRRLRLLGHVGRDARAPSTRRHLPSWPTRTALWDAQPLFAEIDMAACQPDPCLTFGPKNEPRGDVLRGALVRRCAHDAASDPKGGASGKPGAVHASTGPCLRAEARTGVCGIGRSAPACDIRYRRSISGAGSSQDVGP